MNKKIDETVRELRKEYKLGSLDEDACDKDPFVQFELWFQDVVRSGVAEPNAMILATTTPEGRPSCRAVLLKELGKEGFVFYTNYESRKGQEILNNPNVALLFYWDVLERQIRIEGTASRLSNRENDEYFSSRPLLAQVGSYVSKQSSPIPSRSALETAFEHAKLYYQSNTLSRPSTWGGYCVKPTYFEFWQGRESRLHDRIVYTKQADTTWLIKRLAP